MRRLIPPDCESQDTGDHHNPNKESSISAALWGTTDPMSPELRLQFQTLREMHQRQSLLERIGDTEDTDNGDSIHEDDDSDDGSYMKDDDEHGSFELDNNGTPSPSSPRDDEEQLQQIQLALSTSIASQREIDTLMNGISELENFLHSQVPDSRNNATVEHHHHQQQNNGDLGISSSMHYVPERSSPSRNDV